MILVVAGPTASGKSELCCLLAKRLNTEIISADSMAVYRGMDIGTAKPVQCMKEIKHHLVDEVDPGVVFDARMFEERALRAVEDLLKRKKIPLVCGGSYLYLQVLLYGIEDTPPPDWKLRERLYLIARRRGNLWLYRKLLVVDPLYAGKISPNDLRRVVRALEVFLQTGRPFSSFHRWSSPRFECLCFYLKRSRSILAERITQRVQLMIQQGLVEEVKRLMQMGLENFLTSQQAIGYKELIPYLKGEITLSDAVNNIIRNTLQYAKRQMRWFSKQGWIEVDMDALGTEGALSFILEKLKEAGIYPDVSAHGSQG